MSDLTLFEAHCPHCLFTRTLSGTNEAYVREELERMLQQYSKYKCSSGSLRITKKGAPIVEDLDQGGGSPDGPTYNLND